MAFIQEVIRGDHKYYQLVSEYKDSNGKRHKRLIKHIGNATAYRKYQKDLEKKRRDLAVLEGKDIVSTPAMPNELFNVIYADPPWQYDFSETDSRAIENQYPTMPLGKIKKLQIPSEENAVLFLWATAPKLREALEVLDAWGFTYRTNAVWDKEKIGMGYWFRGQHELLLVGVKGEFSPPNTENRVSSVIRKARTEHSMKPDSIYTMLETIFPNGKYLELFARNQRPRWKSWGLEIDG